MVHNSKHKHFKPRRWVGKRREDFPTMSEATAGGSTECANLFYEQGFFGLVWFEGSTRKIRDLKNW